MLRVYGAVTAPPCRHALLKHCDGICVCRFEHVVSVVLSKGHWLRGTTVVVTCSKHPHKLEVCNTSYAFFCVPAAQYFLLDSLSWVHFVLFLLSYFTVNCCLKRLEICVGHRYQLKSDVQACGGTQPTTAADLNPTLPYSGMGSNVLCLCSSVSWQSRMLKRWSQRSWTASPGTAEGPYTTFQFEASGNKKTYAPACSVGEVRSVHEGMLSLQNALLEAPQTLFKWAQQ